MTEKLFTPPAFVRLATARDGATIAYARVNAGARGATPVVLVQGITGVKEDWGHLVGALAFSGGREREVVLMDNRGMGESSAPARAYSMPEFADDVIAVLDACGHAQVDVFGISMGGMIAQHLAVLHPTRVRRVVLGCTSAGPAPGMAFDKVVGRAFVEALTKRPEPGTPKRALVEAQLQMNFSPEFIQANPIRFARIVDNSMVYRRSMRGLNGQLGAFPTIQPNTALQAIKCPVLVVHGDKDEVIPFSEGERLAKLVPTARPLLRLRNAGHMFWLYDDALEVTRRGVLAFLDAEEAKL